jgi:hypothetical protein
VCVFALVYLAVLYTNTHSPQTHTQAVSDCSDSGADSECSDNGAESHASSARSGHQLQDQAAAAGGRTKTSADIAGYDDESEASDKASASPNDDEGGWCANCDMPADDWCTQCATATSKTYYCSVKCQEKDWKKHKRVCRITVRQ